MRLAAADAAARGIAAGDSVRLYNSLGEARCVAAIDATLSAGVAVWPKGLWSHNSLDGNTSNALVPETLTDLGRGACFNDARIAVERLAAPEADA